MSKNELGRYRKLYNRLWPHPGFMSLTDAEKVLALYLLTGPLIVSQLAKALAEAWRKQQSDPQR